MLRTRPSRVRSSSQYRAKGTSLTWPWASEPPRPVAQPRVGLGGLLVLDQQLLRPLGDSAVGVVRLDARQQLEQHAIRQTERPLGRRPAQLDQTPVLVDGARFAPAVCFRRNRPEEVASPQARGLLLSGDRLGDLVL